MARAKAKTEKTKQKRVFRLALKIALSCFAIFLGIGYAITQWLGSPIAQKQFTSWISEHTKWELRFSDIDINVISSQIRIDDLFLRNQTNDHSVSSKLIALSYNPLSFLRGEIQVTSLLVDTADIKIKKAPAPTKSRRRIPFRKLLILRNLELSDTQLKNITVSLPGDKTLHVQNIALHFIPKWLSKVELNVQVQNIGLKTPENPDLKVESISLSGSTALRSWVNIAPFVNDVQGALTVRNFSWRDLEVEHFSATSHVVDSRVSLESLIAQVQGRSLQGGGFVDFSDENFEVDLHWPKPMRLPHLLKDESFFLTEGNISGHIQAKGKGLSLDRLTGDVTLDITHIPTENTQIPAHITTKGHWESGRVTLQDTTLEVGDTGKANASGSIDIANKKIDIQFKGSTIPILGVLGRFRNSNFHPVTGTANCEGQFRGWKRDYLLDLKVNQVSGATYQGIVLDDIAMNMKLTYPRLDLAGKIFQGGQTTGLVDLNVLYGERREDGTRPGNMTLNAKLSGHELSQSLAHLGLTGKAEGTFKITGVTPKVHGQGQVHVRDGSVLGISLDQLDSDIQLDTKQLRFLQTQFKLADFEITKFNKALVMDIEEGFRLRGDPTPSFHIDLSYSGLTKQWTFHDMRLLGPRGRLPALQVKGSILDGQAKLNLDGSLHAEWLQAFPTLVREGQGIMPMKVQISGPLATPNLNGTLELNNTRLLPRDLPEELYQLRGQIQLSGHHIHFKDIKGLAGDGPFTLNGRATHQGLILSDFDLHLEGKDLGYISEDRTLRLEFDTKANIQSRGENTHISGKVDLIDGLYSKNFHLLQQVAQSEAKASREKIRLELAGLKKITLDLAVATRGELLIKNNAAELGLRANVKVTGNYANPIVRGNIETTEGTLHYLGLTFDVTNGQLEFHPPILQPHIEFTGEEVIGAHLVQLTLRGPVNNLQVDLRSVPGEDRKNILCLIAYGNTCDTLRTSQFGSKVGPGVFAEQLARLLERPLTRLTGLDSVRVESAVGSQNISRIHFGKKLTDRLELSFTTTVGEQSTEQSIEADYQLTDNLLLKATRSTRNKSRVNLSIRFRER